MASTIARARKKLAITLQSYWRGHVGRVLAMRERAYVNDWAIQIQRVWRGWRTRVSAQRRTAARAATFVQAFWRGCVGRGCADLLFIDLQVTKIQSVVRGFAARNRAETYRCIATAAALRIQNVVRAWRARQVCKQLINRCQRDASCAARCDITCVTPDGTVVE